MQKWMEINIRNNTRKAINIRTKWNTELYRRYDVIADLSDLLQGIATMQTLSVM